MSTLSPPCEPVLVLTGATGIDPSPHVAAAATAAGATSVLDLGAGGAWPLRILRQAAARAPIGVRIGPGCTAATGDVIDAAGDGLVVVVLTADAGRPIADFAGLVPVLVEVTSLAEARQAVAAGARGLIARGMESGGRTSELSTFVLLQRLLADASGAGAAPIWAAGGIGPRTAAACVAGGAAGVVLDSQLLLLPESEVGDELRTLIARLDGTEVVTEQGLRGVRGPGGTLLAIGQDGWQAASFARQWTGAGTAVRAVRAAIDEAGVDAADLLASGAPLARALGVDLPVAQGPMTRVSDEPAFAAAVAGAGGLPFLALALADAGKTERMMTGAAAALGDRPWGVGVLGFAPDDVRSGQLEVIQRLRPAYAIIAGGRPAQAKVLERAGIGAFLHVPSPGLLRQFLTAGSRRFVFEGAECGGHVGPRASFPLWEAQIEVLAAHLDEAGATGDPIQVFFAGGVHDARSAAMVAALAAPLARRGVQIGVLMGTAYLFTAEAVEHGAIRPLFQREALRAERTALLETAPGHATRCLPTAFVDDFHGLRDGLQAAGVENRQVWEQLEMLNVGRLRVASKGLRRDGDALSEVDEAGQSSEGLFMAGQVAVLRDRVTTIARLHAEVTTGARDLLNRRARTDDPSPVVQASPLDVAIIGMACVFPGSEDLQGYWRTVLAGADAVTEVPRDRWDEEIYFRTGRSASKWGGFLDPVPFDAIGYGIPPAALGSIDPTQLLALEISNRALTDAGYPYDATDHRRTGVVFGAEAGGDLAGAKTLRTTLPAYLGDLPPSLDEQLPKITEDSFPGVLANVIAGRVANRLDLGGPNFTVDAACASSLAALDAACKELSSGGSDLMICGGADLHNGVNDYLMFTSAHALSPTGRCRTFDADGDGIALGEGVAALVLKRLADAERDGDRVYAVVKGVGGASDGRALGLTAPRPEGQRAALDRAYAMAGVSPRDIGLVEAHGTGTVVGDRTELTTLTRMFTEAGAAPGSCAIGSVKSQIGHTKCAAGLAGVIKAALALHTGVKPPTINLTRPNPAWSPSESPFAFHTSARPWAAPASSRFAGVSAFGFGGTNYHAVLAAYAPAADPRHARRDWPAELFCFRGADRAAAHRNVRRLLDRPLSSFPAAAAAWAAESDPRIGPVRIAVVARDAVELTSLLRRALAGEHDPRRGLIQPAGDFEDGRVAFLFPGQGSQRPGGLAELFVSFPELRHYLDLGRDWADLLFPPTAFDPAETQAQKDRLRDTRAAQPALGIGGLAVDHLLRRLGVRPDLAAGHSYGELVALSVSGAFDPATLLTLSRERAACILAAAGSDPGTMAAVSAGAARVTEVLAGAGLAGTVVAANHNTPTQTVISGPTAAVGQARSALASAGLTAREIPVACAFHSPVVAAASATFARVLAGHDIRPPSGEVWANRTAAAYPDTADGVRAELAAQIASPVRFADEITAMYDAGARIFVEAGPGQVLTGLVGAVLGERPHLAVACDGRDGLRDLLIAVGQLACAGVPVNTGWLFQGRVGAPPVAPTRPLWTVDGQLVRDARGGLIPGGLRPARPVRLDGPTPGIPSPVVPAAVASSPLVSAAVASSPVVPAAVATSRFVPAAVDAVAGSDGASIRLAAVTITAGTARNTSDTDIRISRFPEELTMTTTAPRQDQDGAGALLAEYLRTAREMVVSQRDVMLAYLGHPVPPAWPAATPFPAGELMPEMLAPALPAEAAAAPVPPVLTPASGGAAAASVSPVLTPASGGAAAASVSPVLAPASGAASVVPAAAPAAARSGEVPSPRVMPAHPVLGGPSEAARYDSFAGPSTAPAEPAVDVHAAVLAVISDRTGYPVELIELDLDLEADLSVDSIKRAEVAGEVASRLGLSAEGDESELEELVKARTVRAMVDWLAGRIGAAPDVAQAPGGEPAVGGATAAAAVAVAPEAAGAAVAPPHPVLGGVSEPGGHDNSVAPSTAPAEPVVDVQGAVLAVISDRTGYPVELIELDLDLEADLSIDSIKRAEVAGEVASRLGLSAEGDESELEELVKARTVRVMVQWLDSHINGQAIDDVQVTGPQITGPKLNGQPASGQTASGQPAPSPGIAGPQVNGHPVDGAQVNGQSGAAGHAGRGVAPQRLVSARRAAEAEDDVPAALEGARFLITGGAPETPALAELLARRGAAGVTASLDDDPSAADGVVLLDGLLDAPAPLLPQAFAFLRKALAGRPRWVLAAGRPGERTDGLGGLFRTVAREYPETVVRYLEVESGVEVAPAVLRELADRRNAPVVAHTASGRHLDDLMRQELGPLAAGGAGPAGDGVAEVRAIGLGPDSVVVLVGGARGITPWFARALAGAARCRIELIGRTPLPEGTVGPDLPPGADKTALRAALARRGMRSPAEIERTAAAILAAREVEATIAELTDLGAAVRYHAADVRDAAGIGDLLAKIRDEHGRIDGVVYAAGVIEDKLIADKTPESFGRVYATKVDGARNVLDAIGDRVGFVVFFGSIAAAYGNRGQSDYAAANDALDSLGARWAARTGRRLLTVHWGPWAPGEGHGGMVTAELTQEYARRGVGLIDPEEGALSLLRELAWGDPSAT
ncbi:MAG TPA: SDR family NAD(P)-dependent oxidoreductase, partial [Actinoplanes sp.]